MFNSHHAYCASCIGQVHGSAQVDFKMSDISIVNRLFHGPHSNYLFIAVIAIALAIQSCFADVFIDESESPPTEDARERWGGKATKVTRPLMVATFVLIAAFIVWKILQP